MSQRVRSLAPRRPSTVAGGGEGDAPAFGLRQSGTLTATATRLMALVDPGAGQGLVAEAARQGASQEALEAPLAALRDVSLLHAAGAVVDALKGLREADLERPVVRAARAVGLHPWVILAMTRCEIPGVLRSLGIRQADAKAFAGAIRSPDAVGWRWNGQSWDVEGELTVSHLGKGLGSGRISLDGLRKIGVMVLHDCVGVLLPDLEEGGAIVMGDRCEAPRLETARRFSVVPGGNGIYPALRQVKSLDLDTVGTVFLPALEEVDRLSASHSKSVDLPKLRLVGRELIAPHSWHFTAPRLEEVRGFVNLNESRFANLEGLERAKAVTLNRSKDARLTSFRHGRVNVMEAVECLLPPETMARVVRQGRLEGMGLLASRAVVGEWRLPWDKAINEGHCEQWAEELLARLQEAGFEGGEAIDWGRVVRHDQDGMRFDPRALGELGATGPLESLTWEETLEVLRLVPHTWVWDSVLKLHFDAECPRGVENFLDLPIFQRNKGIVERA